LVLAGPLGSGITKTGNADPAREPTFDGCLHESRREEGTCIVSFGAFQSQRNDMFVRGDEFRDACSDSDDCGHNPELFIVCA